MLLLVVHLLLGFRRLRALDCYKNDPMVKRILGLSRLPDVATVSRALKDADAESVKKTRALNRGLVLDRLAELDLPLVTIDFDGSVQFSSKHAEATAVGFNKVKKGSRSYYPLFGTIAQTAQFLDMHHRSGNVNDNNGAGAFMACCIAAIRRSLPKARIEARFDSAFFDQKNLDPLDDDGVEFAGSVPFHRFPALKREVENVGNWIRINATWSYAETSYKPQSWHRNHRFVLLRKRSLVQRKGPLQLDLFEPRDYKFEYKAIVTNKTDTARTVLHFHSGRGSQEKMLGEGKQHAALDVIATRNLHGNQIFTLASMLAHNCARELQMRAASPQRKTTPRRAARWVFESLGSIRLRLINTAGRFTSPQGKLTLTLQAEPSEQADIRNLVECAKKAS